MSSPACCAGLPDFLIACRLSGAGPGTGLNLEILALTAAVVGGNTLGGGRGSVAKGIMGAIIVLVMNNGLIRLGYGTGTNQMVLGLMLAAAVILDIRWLKNRHKVLNEVYVAPVYHRMGETSPPLPGSASPYALNNQPGRSRARSGLASSKVPRMSSSTSDDHLYCGTRHGEIVRFFAPDLPAHRELFAHTGGFPLGLAFDRDGNLISCVGAMGLYSISLATEGGPALGRNAALMDVDRRRCPAARSQRPRHRAGRHASIFTDSTTRYDAHDWALDSIEGRPTGRLLCLRSRDRQDQDAARRLSLCQRRLHRP